MLHARAPPLSAARLGRAVGVVVGVGVARRGKAGK